jgi:hypothetical protein
MRHASDSSTGNRKRIDLSFDSPAIFTTRRDPLRTPKVKETTLPMSSPTSMRASQESRVVEFPDLLGHDTQAMTDEEGAGESGGEVGDGVLVEAEEDAGGESGAESSVKAKGGSRMSSRSIADEDGSDVEGNVEPETGPPLLWDGVEDISETQWQEAEHTRERRRGSDKNREPPSIDQPKLTRRIVQYRLLAKASTSTRAYFRSFRPIFPDPPYYAARHFDAG